MFVFIQKNEIKLHFFQVYESYFPGHTTLTRMSFICHMIQLGQSECLTLKILSTSC